MAEDRLTKLTQVQPRRRETAGTHDRDEHRVDHETDHRAELNVDFDAAIPLLTITGSFGLTVDDALDIRTSVGGGGVGRPLEEFVMPVIAARRAEPQDDLISVLCQAEVTGEDGATQRLSDEEIMSFSALLLTAGKLVRPIP